MNIFLNLQLDQVNLALLALNQMQAVAMNTIAEVQKQAQAQIAPPTVVEEGSIDPGTAVGGTD